MLALLKRELKGFFNTLTGYIVIAVFLVAMGLFLWVIPAVYNVIDAGYADLDGLFVLAPLVFLFLVPALTMRFFSDEIRTGTLEMLVTKPLTDLHIVFSKYLAGIILLLAALLPTLVYVATVQMYSLSPGLDMGGTWGSYLGLIFLGMVFVAIGIFSSVLTDNQIVAFILALFISFFFYLGFETIANIGFSGQADLFVRNLGLQAHYSSMSRGVLDTRDLLYFLGIVVIFLTLTWLKLSWRSNIRMSSLIKAAGVVILVVAINLSGNHAFARFDLTSENRYSLTDATKNMLTNLDDMVYFRVYLDGELPSEFRRLQNDTREMLEEMQAYSDNIQFDFISPAREAGDDRNRMRELYRDLSEKGLEPAEVMIQTSEGASQQVIVPGAIVAHGDRELPLRLMEDHIGLSIRESIHRSALLLEYNIASVIQQVTKEEPARIAFLEGHGQLEAPYLASITRALSRFYDVDRVSPEEGIDKLFAYEALISAKPMESFSEQDKFIFDQYLMQGGSMLWLVDPVFADMDSLRFAPETMGIALDLNMDDFFFHYGARLNPELIQDLHAARIPKQVGSFSGRPQFDLQEWYFFPILHPVSDHEIVKNLNAIRTEFPASIDTVSAEGIDKHVLLQTSSNTRSLPVPVRISLELLYNPPDPALYTGPPANIAVLLEGRFESLFKNRLTPQMDLPESFQQRDQGDFASMIVVADGNIIKNQVNMDGEPMPLGYYSYTGQTFGNKNLILNMVNYLADDSGIIEARAKDVRMRLLDQSRIQKQRSTVQFVNVGLPVLLLVLFGVLRYLFRKRRYA